MTAKSQDPRVRRTRKAFQIALLDLLKNKRFEKISIKEIAETADLSRHAFYSHFDTKEDLLFSYFDDVFRQITLEISSVTENTADLDLTALFTKSFELWKQQSDMLGYVMQVENKDLLLTRFRTHVVALLTIYMQKQNLRYEDPAMFDYFIDFLTGGAYLLLQRWMKEGMHKAPQELAIFIEKMAPLELLIEVNHDSYSPL